MLCVVVYFCLSSTDCIYAVFIKTHAQVLEEICGIKCYFKNKLECEIDAAKRLWLQHFSAPETLTADVSSLSNDEDFDYMTEENKKLPNDEGDLAVWSFGYSCKDLSTLNNFSGAWKKDCLEQKKGSTGITWAGNMGLVQRSRPMILQAENVISALKGQNYQRVVDDLQERGYHSIAMCINCMDYGLPQDRRRAWFAAIRDDLWGPCSEAMYRDVIGDLKLEKPLELEKFILPPGHSYICNVMEERKKRGCVRKKPSGAAATPEPQAKRKKWAIDHWRVRTFLGMPPAGAVPPDVAAVAAANSMCDREVDMWRMFQDAPACPDSGSTPSVELKHSASRVVPLRPKSARRRQDGCTTCLLPSSRLLLRPPIVPVARYLSGLEALTLQGIPRSCVLSNTVNSDKDLLSLAGNAFSGGAAAAVFIATLYSLDFSMQTATFA